MKFNHDISKLKDVITSAQHIVILTHYNPDGDAIGSSTAWLHYLQTIGKQVRFVVPNDFPQNLKWINGSETAVIGNQKLEEAKKIISEADLMICNDFQSFSRIDVLEEQALKAKAFKILVDHHIEPDTEQFDLIFSFTNISSTSE
ncbi:MAG: DHH family phosphoesterase, partial [Bacteroidales bacterium]|nr:DHH family phosphoesterase [Bacteroidales bacterium]